MTMEPIDESGMRFGPYPEGQCFYIEKSQCYQSIQKSVKMAEFLLLRQQKGGLTVWVVEAKSSSPRPEIQPNFAAFIDGIRNKLTHGFLLTVAAHLQRHPAAANELPESFKTLNLQTLGFRFVLVINGHKQEWLPPLQSALSLALQPVVKTWALPAIAVTVLNHELAEKYGLILPAAATAP